MIIHYYNLRYIISEQQSIYGSLKTLTLLTNNLSKYFYLSQTENKCASRCQLLGEGYSTSYPKTFQYTKMEQKVIILFKQ